MAVVREGAQQDGDAGLCPTKGIDQTQLVSEGEASTTSTTFR
jgi:hypothetical protein